MNLMEHLQALTKLWTDATKRSEARLATMVAKDGKFFNRVAQGGTPTVATYDRFITFFRDPQNWPERALPREVEQLLANIPYHVDNDTTAEVDPSHGKIGEVSTQAGVVA